MSNESLNLLQLVERVQNASAELANYGPVSVCVEGRTATEKRMSVVDQGITSITSAALANVKGKLGTAIRGDMAARGKDATVNAAAVGNYRPLAEQIAILTGTSVHVRTKNDFLALGYALGRELDTVLAKKNGGLTSKGTPNAARAALEEAIALVERCYAAYAEQKKADAERREREAVDRALQQQGIAA